MFFPMQCTRLQSRQHKHRDSHKCRISEDASKRMIRHSTWAHDCSCLEDLKPAEHTSIILFLGQPKMSLSLLLRLKPLMP